MSAPCSAPPMPSARPSCSPWVPSTIAARSPQRHLGHAQVGSDLRPPTSSRSACPQGCRLVGVEITDQAIEAAELPPSPPGGLHPGRRTRRPVANVQSICDFVVKIPTRFSVNLGVAGASSCTTGSEPRPPCRTPVAAGGPSSRSSCRCSASRSTSASQRAQPAAQLIIGPRAAAPVPREFPAHDRAALACGSGTTTI